jgi:cytochrome c
MTTRIVIGATVAMIAGGIFGLALRAAPQASGSLVTSGVYTADQAKRGQAVFVESCAKCHLEDLSGGRDSPPLVGNEFLGGWKGKTVAAFFDEVRMTMPFDSPGSLKPEQYIDLIAYLFSANKFPAGDKELANEPAALEQIKFEP